MFFTSVSYPGLVTVSLKLIEFPSSIDQQSMVFMWRLRLAGRYLASGMKQAAAYEF